VANAFRNMTLISSTPYTCTLTLANRQNLLKSLKTTKRHSTLHPILLRTQRYHGVCYSLARGTRDISPDASRRFPKLTSRCNVCPDIFPGCCSGGQRCSQNASILTFLYTTQPSRAWAMEVNVILTTAGISHTSSKNCDQHVQKSIDTSIQLPEDLQCPVKMVEVVQQD
jgi:hypothetical protein